MNMFILTTGLLVGLCTAYFAKRSKRNHYIWFVSGMLFGISALLVMFFLNFLRIKKTKKELEKPVIIEDPRLWYYLDGEQKRYGPLSLNKLKNLWMDNKVFSNTHVWNESFKNWENLKNTKEFSLFPKKEFTNSI